MTLTTATFLDARETGEVLRIHFYSLNLITDVFEVLRKFTAYNSNIVNKFIEFFIL